MDLYKIVCLFVISCMGFISFLQAESTITTKGSIEITGTALSNGDSFFRTKTQIGLEFDFTDNLKGVVRGSMEKNDFNNSAEIKEAYCVIPPKDKLFKSVPVLKIPFNTDELNISDKVIEKFVKTSSRTLFPKDSNLVQQNHLPIKKNPPQPIEKITRSRPTENNSNSDLSS